MSRYVAALVYRKKIGSMARKSILAYCAERANDDGSGVWSSKVTISKEVECSKKTVIETFNAFVDEGILIATGKRKVSNGFVHVYRINLPAVERLDDAISRDELRGVNLNPSPDVTPRGEAELPQEVTSGDPNRPKTVLKPSCENDDLFSAESEGQEQEQPLDLIEEGFQEFWADIWPRHERKAGKADCRKVYAQACRGKHPKADKIAPSDLNAAARRFIASVKDKQYLPGPLPWLRKPGWEPFIAGPDGSAPPGKPMSYAQRLLAGQAR